MAKAKAFITRHPAWTTIFIVLFAGLFMGAKWLEPQPDVMDGAQFSTVQRGNLRVTVAEGGALDSTSKLNLKCELDNGGTIVSLVAEGTYVDGPSQYQVSEEDTLQSITEKHMHLANVPTADKPAGKAEQRAFEEALRTANPDLDWENLELGQTVQIPGALLVKFEDADLREKILFQEKSVADAERDLGNAKKDLALRRIETASANRQAALDVEFAQQDLDRYIEGDTPLQLLKMEGDIALAEEEIKRAEEKLASTRKLREKGYATSLEVQSNELTIKKQQNSITQTKKQQELFLKFEQPQQKKRYEAKLDQATVEEQRTIQKSNTLVESAEGTVLRRSEGLKAQQERLVLYKEQLIKSEMRAPQDGLVIYARSSSRYNDTYIKEGALIRKGYSVIDLPDISELMAVVQVHESFVRHIKTGQKAVVRIDSLPDREFQGVVRHVAPTPDARRKYYENISVYDTHVWIQDENSQLPEDLKPGVSAKAEIVVAELNDVMMVPVQSVTTYKGQKVVQVKRGENVVVVPVKTGQFNNRFIEIKDGLKEGDQVSLAPNIDENSETQGDRSPSTAITSAGS
ncbi:MAG: efflux RND transporter periplasmic adaptor subunit [Pedosphaera sp.]|nr:efflux RND transporter periplasmic adaptor subunit [Pedosphaera sp.]